MKKPIVAAAVLAALMGASFAHAEHGAAKHDATGKTEREKCFGVAKEGRNDCASKDGKNGCAGSSKRNADPNDWIYLPVGVCDKLAGGKVEK